MLKKAAEEKEKNSSFTIELPEIETIEKLYEVILQGLEHSTQNYGHKNFRKWGFALVIPESLRTAASSGFNQTVSSFI